MAAARKPAAEVAIDASLVRGLLADQHLDLAGEPLEPLAEGWDNALYRLGARHVVRLPRRAAGAELILHEHRWLPELAPRLPLPIPLPLRRGGPGRGYPWAWSICPWLEGRTAAEVAFDGLDAARALGRFLRSLHLEAPAEAPSNPVRGVSLTERDAALRERLAALGDAIDAAAVLRVWDDALAAPVHPGPALWLHGDLHPANLLVQGGRLSAVLDFGDLAGGDPATDLSVAWTLLPADARETFRDAVGGPSDPRAPVWRRARGWALNHAVACLATSADDARMRRMGAGTLAHVLSDPGPADMAGAR